MKTNRIRLAAICIAVIMMTVFIAYGLQATPYHEQRTGVKIYTYSQFCGDRPGIGEYKAKKGKYIRQAWVSIKEGSYSKKKFSAKATSKTDSTFRTASLSKNNNPVKPQTLDYNWIYR